MSKVDAGWRSRKCQAGNWTKSGPNQAFLSLKLLHKLHIGILAGVYFI
jgi:hypothetical protein